MKTATILRSLAFFAMAILSVPAMAFSDLVGTWTGTFSGTDGHWDSLSSSCSTAGPRSGTITLNLASTGDGTATTVDNNGTSTFDISSGFESAPTFGFDLTETNSTPAFFASISGTYSGDSMSFPIHGNDGSECNFTGTANLTRGGGDTTVIFTPPEETPGTSVTSNTQTLATSVTTTTGFLNARVLSALKGSQHVGVSRAGRGFMAEASGLSAGDTFNNIGMWASYAYTDFENDFSRTKFDGDTDTFFVGIDFTPSDNAVLGLAIGYEDTNTDTDFNGGKSDADGYTFAPYFGMTLDETWSFDLMGGFSSIDTDQYRALDANGNLIPRISSDVDTDRLFFAGNINGFTSIDQWRLSGRVGAMYARSTDDGFAESDGTVVAERISKLSQFTLGGEAAYAFDEFEPFVSAAYNYDMTSTETQFATGRQPSSDRDDFLVGLGFRYFGESGLSVSAQYDTRLGRSDYDEDTFSINARWDF